MRPAWRLRWLRPIAGSAALLLLAPLALDAQSAPPEGVERRWEVVGSLGFPFGSSNDELEVAMRRTGWADPIGGVDYPSSSGATLWWALSLRYRLTRELDVRLVGGRAMLGSTSGHRHELPGSVAGYLLPLDQSVLTIAPVLSYRGVGWSAGAGPAFNRARVTSDPIGDGFETAEAWKVGIMAETGVAFPRESRLFLDARVQYRWIPGLTAGPFTVPDDFQTGTTATFPATEVDLSHTFASAGIGVRL